MKVSRFIIVVLLLVSSLVSAAAQDAPQEPVTALRFKPGVLLVKFNGDLSASMAQDVMQAYGATFERNLLVEGVQVWRVAEGQELSLAARMTADPRIAYAEPDYRYSVWVAPRDAAVTPNDPGYSSQWAHPKINSPQAWDITQGSASVVIAIVDTGVDAGHPDLSSKLVTGYDAIDGDNNPRDGHGHGTHVSGIAAAHTNNGVGVAGLGWNASIMPIRVLGDDGSGWSSDIAEGVTWAYQHGAKIINLSLGGPDPSQTMQDTVNNAHNAGALVIAAMGNAREDDNPTSYPAAYNNVFAVAATAPDDTFSYFSQYGPHCDIAAPGGEMGYLHDPNGIYSTMPTYNVTMVTQNGYNKNYDFVHGTSQATPYVSGLAALIWSLDDSLTPDEVQQIIEDTAVDLGPAGWDKDYGHGRIDAYAAVQAVKPAAPTLDPISNADGDGDYTVGWSSVSGATYTLEEDSHASFPAPTTVYSGTNTSYNVTGQTAGVWYYRVKATKNGKDSNWSNTESVGVVPTAPTLSPISNVGNSDAYTLTWSAPTGAVQYTLQEANNSAFSNASTRYVGSATSYSVTGQRAGTWYYRVLASNSVGDSAWSSSQSTTVDPLPLSAPNLAPIDNSDGDGSYSVSWSSVVSATYYVLEESRSPYFDAPSLAYSGTMTTHVVTDQAGGTWHYRVRAFGDAGGLSSPWSISRSATVSVEVYLPLALKSAGTSVAASIANGDFENGSDGSWTESSSGGWDLIQSVTLQLRIETNGSLTTCRWARRP